MVRLMTLAGEEPILGRLYDALDHATDIATREDALEQWSEISAACQRAGELALAGGVLASLANPASPSEPPAPR